MVHERENNVSLVAHLRDLKALDDNHAAPGPTEQRHKKRKKGSPAKERTGGSSRRNLLITRQATLAAVQHLPDQASRIAGGKYEIRVSYLFSVILISCFFLVSRRSVVRGENQPYHPRAGV